jgi:hypothetical protein
MPSPRLQERLAKAATERLDRAYFHPDSKRHAKDERVRGRMTRGAAAGPHADCAEPERRCCRAAA